MAKKETGEQKRQRESRHFLVDIGYDEGEQFCKNLIATGDFGGGFLSKIAPRGIKSLPKAELAAELATILMTEGGAVDPEAFLLGYCKRPRLWLALRRGWKQKGWPQKRTARQFLSRREPGSDIQWYGPFGTEDHERWYIATKNVPTHSGGVGEVTLQHWIRWHVIAQVTPDFVALHWNNCSTRAEDPNDWKQFPYYRHIPEMFADLASEIGGGWNKDQPNLADVILHGSFDRYGDSAEHVWKHKRIRSYYNTVAVNASGGSGGASDDDDESEQERAATGLQILTEALALTATQAIGHGDDVAMRAKVERALLRKILHDWGTKSYEFVLDRKATIPPPEDDDDDVVEGDDEESGPESAPRNQSNKIARMHIYFGTETPRGEEGGGIDSLQHAHCYGRYGGSTGALEFILGEVAQHDEAEDASGDYDDTRFDDSEGDFHEGGDMDDEGVYDSDPDG